MAALIIEVQDNEVRAALNQLAERVGNASPFLKALGEDIVARSKARFQASTGPDGQRWAPNARSTIEAYIAKKGGFGKRGINKKGQGLAMSKKPLIGESRDLSRQIFPQVTGNALVVGSSPIYAAIQQFGGQAGRGKKATIPARPFLPVTQNGELYPAERAAILDALNAWLAGK